jgi:hypothetical protein
MSECPECGQPLAWAGTGWAAHTDRYHEGVRRRLYGAVRRLVDQVVRDQALVAQAGARGLVGIRAVSGVYRGLVMWHDITEEFWDELGEADAFMTMDREWLLRHLRESASDAARWKYGVDVNPATWRQTVYDAREA